MGENVDNERCAEGGDHGVLYFKTHLTKIKTKIEGEKK